MVSIFVFLLIFCSSQTIKEEDSSSQQIKASVATIMEATATKLKTHSTTTQIEIRMSQERRESLLQWLSRWSTTAVQDQMMCVKSMARASKM